MRFQASVAIVSVILLSAASAIFAQRAPAVYRLDLIPAPHPGFHEHRGGWPTQLSNRTFQAASGAVKATVWKEETQ